MGLVVPKRQEGIATTRCVRAQKSAVPPPLRSGILKSRIVHGGYLSNNYVRLWNLESHYTFRPLQWILGSYVNFMTVSFSLQCTALKYVLLNCRVFLSGLENARNVTKTVTEWHSFSFMSFSLYKMENRTEIGRFRGCGLNGSFTLKLIIKKYVSAYSGFMWFRSNSSAYVAWDILTILMTKFQKEGFVPKSINLCPASN